MRSRLLEFCFVGMIAMAFGAALGITDNWSANAGVGFGFGKDTKASVRIGTNYKFKLF